MLLLLFFFSSFSFLVLSYDVSLFVRSEGLDSQASNEVIENFYGVSNKNIEVVTYNSKRARGAEFF